MTPSHLNDDQLLHTLYGSASAAQCEHVERCALCGQRQLEFQQKRMAQTQIRPAASAALYRQRAAILERVAAGTSAPWRTPTLAAAALAAGLVTGAFLTFRPAGLPVVVPESVAEVSQEDTDLAELWTVEYSTEARAALPLRGLFEASEVVNSVEEK